MSTPLQTPNLGEVISQSRRIINANLGRFLSLSLLLLFPLCFCVVIYPTQIILRYTSHLSTLSLPLLLLYTLFIFLLWVSTLATITHTTYHAFYGRTLTLSSTLKSILHSLIPLISTTLASLTSLGFPLLAWQATRLAQTHGFQIDYQSTGFIAFCVAVSIVSVGMVSYLQVNWALASVIAVVESKWGFEPLRRSAYLVRGMRKVSFFLLLIFIAGSGMLVGGYSMWVDAVGVNRWRDWTAMPQLVECSFCLMVYMFYYTVANTVVYVYCKASHGEFANAEEELAHQYVSVPFDDENGKLTPGVSKSLVGLILATYLIVMLVIIVVVLIG